MQSTAGMFESEIGRELDDKEALKAFSPRFFAFPEETEAGYFDVLPGKAWFFTVVGQTGDYHYKMQGIFLNALAETNSKWSKQVAYLHNNAGATHPRYSRSKRNRVWPDDVTMEVTRRTEAYTLGDKIDINTLAVSSIAPNFVSIPITLKGNGQVGFKIINNSAVTYRMSALVIGWNMGVRP